MQNHARISGETKAGSTLVFVLGVLALLSILGMALVFIVRQEAKTAKSFGDEMRARFAAESGVEYALSKLQADQGSLIALRERIKTVPDKADLPLDYILESSFGTLDLDLDGLKETSGILSETYVENGDTYKLRVQTADSKLNINDTNSPLNIDTDPYEDQWTPERNYLDIPEHLRNKGHSYPPNDADRNDPTKDRDPDWVYPGDAGYDTAQTSFPDAPYPKAPGRLWTIVSELVGILFPNDPNPALGNAVANAIFNARKAKPGDRFDSFSELEDVLVPKVLSKAQYQTLISFFTLQSWQDPNVIRPTFQWRINTPPVIDIDFITPDLPATQHLSDFPGDGSLLPDPAFFGPLLKRPGHLHADQRGADMADEVSHDYDLDGTIESWEISYHDRDIYLFSDMQTRYFAEDRRSPININEIPRELMEALISPISGWYLQEAPATWRGEDIRSRAEDWDQPLFQLPMYYDFPWLVPLRMNIMTMADGNDVSSWYLFAMVDESQYYYYDAYAKLYLKMLPPSLDEWNNWVGPWAGPQYCEKSARFGELQQTESFQRKSLNIPEKTIARILAEKVFDRIHASDTNGDGNPDFNPFQTWEEFEEFIVDLADLGQGDTRHLTGELKDFDIYMAHSIIANFNPNARLNDFNPDKKGFLFVDKSQLIGYSTEFCFFNLGEVQIESLGMIKDPNGVAVVSSKIRCLARSMSSFRLSTQEQFMRGYDGFIESAKAILGSSNGENPTAGADNPHGLLPSNFYYGHSLQSYPEPELPTANHMKQSCYDGCLRLATLQPHADDIFATTGGGEFLNNLFLANFDRKLDAAKTGGDGSIKPDMKENFWILDYWRFTRGIGAIPRSGYPLGFQGWDWDTMYPDLTAQIPANNPGIRPLCKSVENIFCGNKITDTPGNLFPDGALSDAGRTPIYECRQNLGDPSTDPAGKSVEGRRGSVQFWVKPNFDVVHSNRIRNLFCAPPRAGYDYGDYGLFSETWPVANPLAPSCDDLCEEFTLYYFSRGGRRVVVNPDTGRLDDDFHMSYHANYDINGDGRWLPTRSLLFANGTWPIVYGEMEYYAQQNNPCICAGIGSSSVNQSWREAEDVRTPGIPEINLESHQWSHIALAWDWMGDWAGLGQGWLSGNYTPPARYFRMAVNGKYFFEDREQRPKEVNVPSFPTWMTQYQFNFYGSFGTDTYTLADGFYTDIVGVPLYFRFGETSSAWWKNNVADATYDDFVSSKIQHDDPALIQEFSYGRYYANNDAVYTSPEFDIFKELGTQADLLMLRSISWTAYWPLTENSAVPANHPRFNDNLRSNNSNDYMNVQGIEAPDFSYNPLNCPDPMAAKWGRNWIPFSVDILDPRQNKWRYEDNGVAKEKMPNFAGDSQDSAWGANPLRWEKRKGDKLSFKVHFNILEGQTLFVSPIFEDITFVFTLGNIQILNWEILE